MVARHENPRSSATRDHSTMSSPVAPGVVLGSPIPIFTRSPFPGVGSNNPTGPGAPPTGQLLTRPFDLLLGERIRAALGASLGRRADVRVHRPCDLRGLPDAVDHLAVDDVERERDAVAANPRDGGAGGLLDAVQEPEVLPGGVALPAGRERPRAGVQVVALAVQVPPHGPTSQFGVNLQTSENVVPGGRLLMRSLDRTV